MKTRKEHFELLKDAVKRTFLLYFFFSPFILVIVTIVYGLGVALGGLRSLNMTFEDCSHALRIMGPVLIIYLIIWYKIFLKVIEKDERKREQEKKERLTRLEAQYANYVSLVQEVTKEHSKLCLGMVNNDYLLTFEDYLNRVRNYRNTENPNSFDVAACLMYSLIDEETVNNSENVNFAMECALKIISEPITYYYKEGERVEEKQPKVDIVLADNLMSNIKEAIVQDYKQGKTSIMQMANLLHLIYLNSSNK